MREILFRGKSKDNYEWIYGGFVSDGFRSAKYIVEHGTFGGLTIFNEREVISETIGQYTGLTDKNGKKIFEGDIVDCWSEGVNAQGTVQQRRDGLWIIYPAWQKHIMWGLCPDEYSHTTVEVIGNIYDNPELIKT